MREDTKGIFEVMEKNQGGIYVRERKYRTFSDGEAEHGGFEQNTGGSKKKFNIKIPKWEQNRVREASKSKFGHGQTTTNDEPF